MQARLTSGGLPEKGTTFAVDRPVVQGLMDERVDQQANFRCRRRTTAQPHGCYHFGGSCLWSYMEAASSSPFRSSLRGRLRPLFRPLLRGPAARNAGQRPLQRRFRAWRFADIPTPPPGQNIESVIASSLPSRSSPRPLHSTPALSSPRWLRSAFSPPRRPKSARH
jgi:hypothetical protein